MADLPNWVGMEWLVIGLLVLAGLMLLPYLLGPILIYFTMRIAGDPVLEEIELEDRDTPKAVRKYVFDTTEHLAKDGFETLGVYFLDGFVPNVENFLALVGNRSTRDLVLVAVTYAKSSLHQPQQKHVDFSTRTSDGTIIDTNNSEELSAFKRVPEHRIVSLPWIKDVRYLYRVHRAVVERFSPNAAKEWRVGHDPADYLREALLEEVTRQLDTGYLYRDATGDFRPTVKGAILMTYKNLWPFTALQRARRKRRGERLLRELQV